MVRPLLIASLAGLSLGCAGTWDTLTSRRFREHPMQTTQRMFVPEDPVAVLLANPPREGDERAAAMRRLKEPIRGNGTQQEQDAILAVLEEAAVRDSSPVLRLEAITALGRFEDLRASAILMAAYQNAHGRKPTEVAPPRPNPTQSGVVPAGASAGRTPTIDNDRFPLSGPTGFPPEWVTAIRCRSAESLGRSNRPEAARFLAAVAGAGDSDIHMDGSEERDVRLAAVRGLAKCRQPEAVVALAQVLTTEAARQDTALVGRAHEGLVRLTGKKLPADPQQWSDVVQAGVVVVPEPTWFESMIETAMFWQK